MQFGSSIGVIRTNFGQRIHCRYKKFVRRLHWPSTPDPTPYQIFGLESEAPVTDKRKLRGIYYQLVKQYHPDRGVTGNADRFKKVVEAHNILRDDASKRRYDLSQRMSQCSSNVRAYRQRSNAFEDDIDINYWSNRNQERFDKGLHENRKWVLKLVCFVTISFAFLNMLMLKGASNARNEALNIETEKAAALLAHSVGNYGKGGDAKQRIERFLDERQRMLDRFDSEFRWNKLKGGLSRNPSRQSASRSGDEGRIEGEDDVAGMQDQFLPAESKRGKPQMKHCSGPVAEYFGRNQ